MEELKNPFLMYGYVGEEYFCDREQETSELLAALKNGRNVTLRSPRRIGKTGLIMHTFHLLEQTRKEDVKCFYVDLFSTHTLDDFVIAFGKAVIGQLDTPMQKMQNFVITFFKSCRLYFSADPLTGAPTLGIDLVEKDSQKTLEEIFAYINQSGRECYIAFDEFQQITEYPEKGIEALLRTHIQQCPQTRFIFSGSKQHLMSEIFTSPKRPFFRSTDKLTLDVIAEQTYYKFAKRWFDSIDTILTEAVFHTIYSLVDGSTWYVQYILNRLFELRPKTVSDELVRESIDYIVQREQDDYRHWYNLLTVNQAQVLRAIAKEHCVASPTAQTFISKYHLPAVSSVRRVIDYLTDKEYIYPSDNGYIVYDRFMAIWLERL